MEEILASKLLILRMMRGLVKDEASLIEAHTKQHTTYVNAKNHRAEGFNSAFPLFRVPPDSKMFSY